MIHTTRTDLRGWSYGSLDKSRTAIVFNLANISVVDKDISTKFDT